MRRTSWRDLLDGAGTPSERSANDRSASGAAASGAEAEREARRAASSPSVPRSLDDVPELQNLLAERRKLEEQLRQLTGSGRPVVGDARETRRFPLFSSEDEPRLGLRTQNDRDERDRDAERRALEVDNIDERRRARGAEERQRDLSDRAARRRRAGAERVAQAAATWDQHREDLLAARDLARDAAMNGRGLVMPGADVSSRVARLAQGLASGLDSLRNLGERGTAAEPARPRSRERDNWAELRDGARELGRFAETALADTDVGRRLSRLREELAPPEIRDLPDYTGEGDVDVLEQRRQRALAALRDRREEEPAPRVSPRQRRDPEPAPRTTTRRAASADTDS